MKWNGIPALMALVVLTQSLHAQESDRPPLPLSYRYWQQNKDKPDVLKQLGAALPAVAAEGGAAPAAPLPSASDLLKLGNTIKLNTLKGSNELQSLQLNDILKGLKPSRFAPESAPAQLWSNLAAIPPGGPYNFGNPLLLTDGSVIVHRTATPEWYKLTPSNTGSYVNGTWSKIASMDPGYGPMYFASAVLPDGRVIAEGGEYNLGKQVWTSLGALYDPTSGAGGAWTPIAPPTGWSQIGDGQSAVLANGTFVLADCCDGVPFRAALFNSTSLTWTATGTGKADNYDEEGWTLIPNGQLLTVDSYTTPINGKSCYLNTELYDPGSGSWSAAGNVPSQLADCNAENAQGGSNPSYEMGPQVLMYNSKVIAFGGTGANVAHTALYDTALKTWSAGPDLPSKCGLKSNEPCTLADAAATLLPSGNVLFVASAGLFNAPANFFEYSPKTNQISGVPGTADASKITSYFVNFLILPTGQVLTVENQTSTIQIYSPLGSVQNAWRPAVTASPACVVPSSGYALRGTQLNGLSQGSAYGDDQQAATNYALVRIVNQQTSHVAYARTYGPSTMTVAANAASTTHFTVSKDTETGQSTLYAVANGVASAGTPILVSSTPCPANSGQPGPASSH